MLATNCTICFKPGNTLSVTDEINEVGPNETLKIKLQYIVPEMVCLPKLFFIVLY